MTHTHTQPTRRYIWQEELMCSEEFQQQREAKAARDPEGAGAKHSSASIDFD